KESGEMANLLLLTGAGGDYHSHPDFPLTPDEYDRSPFGLLEAVIDASTLFDSDDPSALEKGAKSRAELLANPRIYIPEAELTSSAPIDMADLIPGRRVEVHLDVGPEPLISTYRL